MKHTLTKNEFIDEFKIDGYDKHFSYEALDALFDYYERWEEETGEEIEIDVTGICGDWSEYDNIKEVLNDYDKINSLKQLKEATEVIELPNGHLLVNTNF